MLDDLETCLPGKSTAESIELSALGDVAQRLSPGVQGTGLIGEAVAKSFLNVSALGFVALAPVQNGGSLIRPTTSYALIPCKLCEASLQVKNTTSASGVAPPECTTFDGT